MDYGDLTLYWQLALLWTLYCVVHSALISVKISNYFRRVLGNGYRFYRLCFNIFSLATLIPLVLYSRSHRFRTAPLFSWSGYWRIFQLFLIVLAGVLIIAGARRYSLRVFFGIQQLKIGNICGALTDNVSFNRSGVFSAIRHPWYAATFIILWTMNLNISMIIVNLILSIYLVIGTYLEERKLIHEFGSDYRRYQDEVSIFIPIKWFKVRLKR
jgi:hypothetical protein